MAFCDQAGIPHSQILGRVPGPGEPLWTEEDRAKMVAYRAWQLDERYERCPGCGERHDEWMDDNGDILRDAPKKVVAEPAACGCELLDEAKEATKGRRDLRFRLVDVDDPAVGVTEGSL